MAGKDKTMIIILTLACKKKKREAQTKFISLPWKAGYSPN